jgi:hypothetical protein
LAQLSGDDPGVIHQLLQDADVDASDAAVSAGRSTLNNDGYPLQGCVTTAVGSKRFRILFDPAATELCPVTRYHRACQAFLQLPTSTQGIQLAKHMQLLLSRFHPGVLSMSNAINNGLIWIACDSARRGFAVYMTAKWCAPTLRWYRVRHWLDCLTDTTLSYVVSDLSSITEVVSVGLEGSRTNNLRAKIYFRLMQPMLLASMGNPLYNSDAVIEFLRLAISDFTLSRSGLVFSLSLDLTSKQLADIKVDVCGHCTPRNTEGWRDVVQQLTSMFCLEDLDFEFRTIEHCEIDVAFIGFGLMNSGGHRLNLYLKPTNR